MQLVSAADLYCVFLSLFLFVGTILWLRISCKVPFKFWSPSVTVAHCTTLVYLYVHLSFSVFGIFLALLKILLPKTVLAWALTDFSTGFCFMCARAIPRLYFSVQLRTILDNVVSKSILLACTIVAYFFLVLQSFMMGFGIVQEKYGSLDVILQNGIVPDNVPLIEYQLSISFTAIIILSALALDTFQLYLFYQGTKLLRHDLDRKKAISIVLISFVLSSTAVSFSGIAVLIPMPIPNATSFFSILYYFVDPCVILMPFVVKRYNHVANLVTWIVAVMDKQYTVKSVTSMKSTTHFIEK